MERKRVGGPGGGGGTGFLVVTSPPWGKLEAQIPLPASADTGVEWGGIASSSWEIGPELKLNKHLVQEAQSLERLLSRLSTA
jgi:hypothetical protein